MPICRDVLLTQRNDRRSVLREKITGEPVGAAGADSPREGPQCADLPDVLHQARSGIVNRDFSLVRPGAYQNIDLCQPVSSECAAMLDDRSVGEKALRGLVREDERQGAPDPIAFKAVP